MFLKKEKRKKKEKRRINVSLANISSHFYDYVCMKLVLINDRL